MLARFAALAKQAEEEKRQEQEIAEREAEESRLKEEKEKEFSSWVTTANKPVESTSKSNKETTYDTVVKAVDKSDLVWAPCHVLKGNSSHAMARICEFGEAALEPNIDWPIPDNHVLVEYFCLPTTSFSRFAVIPPTRTHTALERCLPFNSPLKKGSKQGSIIDAFSSGSSKPEQNEHNQWDPDRVTSFYNSMKAKYTIPVAKTITNRCLKVADQFLKLALEKRSTEAVYEEAREETDIAIEESRQSLRESIAASGDLSKYTLKSSSLSHKEEEGVGRPGREERKRRKRLLEARTLRAGDFIGYQCKIFKEPRRCQIIRVKPKADHPLTLANDDIIYMTDLIVKHTDDSTSSSTSSTTPIPTPPSSEDGSSSGGRRSSRSRSAKIWEEKEEVEDEVLGSCQLSEFTLVAGAIDVETTQKVLARQTKSDLEAITKETGVALNTMRSRKKARTTPT